MSSVCLILTVLWTLLAYVAIPLPLEDPFFAWIRRQWLFEGIAILACLGTICSAPCPPPPAPRPASRAPAWWWSWLVWLGWAAVSVGYSIDRGVSLRSLIAYASYGLLAWVTASCATSPKQRDVWVRFLVLAAVIVSLEGLIQHAWSFQETLPMLEELRRTPDAQIGGWGGAVLKDFLVRKRIFSVFGWPNLFAGFLLLTTPMAIGLAVNARHAVRPPRHSLGPWPRDPRRGIPSNNEGWATGPLSWGWALAAGLLGLCLVLTLSLGGWMAAVLTGAVAWWLLKSDSHFSKKVTVTFGRVLLIGAVASVLLLVTSFIVAKRAQGMIAGSVSSRVVYAASAAKLIAARPLTGTGIGTFGLAYQTAMPEAPVEGQHTALHAHNTLLEFGAEMGLIGLLLFGWFLWRVWQLIVLAIQKRGGSWKLEAGGWKTEASNWELETRECSSFQLPASSLQHGLAVGLLAFFIHSLLEQTFVEAVTAPFWWIVLGLLSASSQKPLEVQGSGFGVQGSCPQPRAPNPEPRWVLALPLGLASISLVLVGRLVMADAWAARAAFHDLAGRRQEATVAFERAQQWDPLAHRYPLELGQRVEATGEGLRRAHEAFERTVTLSPWLGYAWMRLGVIQWQVGMREQAIASMRTAVKRDPNSRASLQHLAHMLNAAARYPELRVFAGRLQRLEPNDPNGYFLEALAWQGLQQPDEAVAAYQRLLRRLPAHHPAWFNLAELERRRGRVAEAQAAYRQFLLHAPASEQATRAAAEQ